jgi:hypothetical protein
MSLNAIGELGKGLVQFDGGAPPLVPNDESNFTFTTDRRLRSDATIVGPVIVSPGEPLLTPISYQQIVGVTSAAATFLAVPGGAEFAWVQIENGDARWRGDAAPTATVGQPLLQDTGFFFNIGNPGLIALQFIAQSGPVTINVYYYL